MVEQATADRQVSGSIPEGSYFVFDYRMDIIFPFKELIWEAFMWISMIPTPHFNENEDQMADCDSYAQIGGGGH